MKKEFAKIQNFIESLEEEELTEEQQSVLMVGEDTFYGGTSKNRVTCENTKNTGCSNSGSCSYSNNTHDCNNTGYCNNTNNDPSCTGGSSGGSGGSGGTGGTGYRMLGFPGFSM